MLGALRDGLVCAWQEVHEAVKKCIVAGIKVRRARPPPLRAAAVDPEGPPEGLAGDRRRVGSNRLSAIA